MIKLYDLPIAGGKVKLLNMRCNELWKGYSIDIPEEYKNEEIDRLQAEIESYNREILVIVLKI